MSITNTYLTVTPTWENKRLTVAGSASVRESVALTIVGCGADTSVVFKLSSENGRVDYAKFPNADTDAWVVDGDDLTGTLNLNTDLLVAAFAPWGPDDRLSLVFTVASATDSNLFSKGCIQIGNWMEDADDPVAYSTPLADAIDELTTDFEEHTHDGTDAPQVAHEELTGIGANTHDQIDTAILGFTAADVTHTSGIATNASNIAANALAIRILNDTETGQDPGLAAVLNGDFTAVDALPTGTTTTKALREKLNEILAILKG
jgi:hypothetical protein